MNLRRIQDRMCLSDGDLRRVVDCGIDESSSQQSHLNMCARCRDRLHEMHITARFADRRLAMLAGDDTVTDLGRARVKLQHKMSLEVEERSALQARGETFMSSMWSHRVARGAVAMLAIMVLTTAFVATPMRSLADNLFNRFEVERFEAITIQPEAFTEFGLDLAIRAFTADQERIMLAAENLYEIETTFDQEDVERNAVKLDSIDDARAAYGEFKLPATLPDGYDTAPEFLVTNAGSATVTVDTAAVHVIIDELRLPIDSVPSATDMPYMVFQADVPAALVTHYGSGLDGHLAVIQMESPTITTPDGLDMDALREDVLSMPGLPEDFVAQLRAIDDWQKTLVVPVPAGAETREVTINGQGGLLVEAGAFDASEWGIDFTFDGEASVVMWNDGGTLFIVAGTLDGDTVMDVANSVR